MPFTGLLFGLLGLLPQVGSTPQSVPVQSAQIVATFPHDNRAFTEGLFWQDGYFYESTGELNRSGIRKVRLSDGKVMARVAVDPPLYGEGIAPWNGTILSLTWKNQVGFRWSVKDFKKLGSFKYQGEGWALAADDKGGLIMSDGSPVLRFVDPATFTVKRRLTVTDGGRPVKMLNELEYVDGEILANIWLTDLIARIDPQDGHVIGWIDVSELHRQSGATAENDVPNGIAWDAKKRRLFVTGKDWPYMFQIKAPKDTASSADAGVSTP
jgi:glutaminyl-peptide cyclotransferase